MQLREGLEYGDLKRLIKPVLSIDEYRSKMGDDKDIIVIGFTVYTKEPAADLSNFIEKSYDWVLDADISSGETEDGNYIVFAEIERSKDAIKQIMKMIEDILNLTEHKLEDWKFKYFKNGKEYEFSEEVLTKQMITDPDVYEKKVNVDESALNSLKALAHVPIRSRNVSDPYLVNIQVAAGIK